MGKCCGWYWIGKAGAFLALAALLLGVGLQAQAARGLDDETKKKEQSAKQEKATPPNQTPPNPNAQLQQQYQQQYQQQMQQYQRFQGRPFGFGGNEARLGLRVTVPDPTLEEQLDLPKNEGLVIEDVIQGSAAEKAGFKRHDILLDLNGKPVSRNIGELMRTVQGLEPNKGVDAVVIRKGKKETLKGIKVPERPAAPQPPFGRPGPGRVLPPGGGPGQRTGPGFSSVFPPGGGPGAVVNPNSPAYGGFQGGPGFNGKTVSTTTFRTDDHFTTRHQEGPEIITITGNVTDGKAKVDEIYIQNGRDSKQYSSVAKVPEKFRDEVKNLVDLTERGNSPTKSKPAAEEKQPAPEKK
jgi:hypothetical protein